MKPLHLIEIPDEAWCLCPIRHAVTDYCRFVTELTYLVPASPLILAFDAVVSNLRIYSVARLRDLTAGLERYRWDIGTVRGKVVPIQVTYLIGCPVEGDV